MRDHLVAVRVGFEEPELHPVQWRDQRVRIDLGERAVVHHRGGAGGEDALSVELAALQVRDHEAGHVRPRRRERPGWPGANQLELGGTFPGLGIAGCHPRHERFGQRLAERRGLHPERLENMPLDVQFERLIRPALDDVCSQGGRPVRVRRGRSRGVDPLGLGVFQESPDGLEQRRVIEQDGLGLLFESRSMRQYLAQRHRFAFARRDAEIEIDVDVTIEIELALFDQLHDRRPGHKLRDRARSKQGSRRIHRPALGEVGIAKPARGKDSAVLDHHHHRAGDVAAVECVGQISVEPGVYIRFLQLMARGRPDDLRDR